MMKKKAETKHDDKREFQEHEVYSPGGKWGNIDSLFLPVLAISRNLATMQHSKW